MVFWLQLPFLLFFCLPKVGDWTPAVSTALSVAGQVETGYLRGEARRAEVQLPYKAQKQLTVEAGSNLGGRAGAFSVLLGSIDFLASPVSHQTAGQTQRTAQVDVVKGRNKFNAPLTHIARACEDLL
ncbi:hypothetical protein J3F83DRAFT_756161 [Trichoderma novae-zelandiae]